MIIITIKTTTNKEESEACALAIEITSLLSGKKDKVVIKDKNNKKINFPIKRRI